MDSKANLKIGYYVSQKKNAKMNWTEFGTICRRHGFILVKLDISQSLEEQGPFFAIVHKMTEIILNSSLGDPEATTCLQNVESYINSHPEVIVIDPLDNLRILLDRSRCYQIVQSSDLAQHEVFTPTFVELKSSDVTENVVRLREAGVTFPFVCKPSVSHGCEAHQMAIVFDERGVADCKPPCVAQSFINHNAVLFKIYIAGDQFIISKRPSLKNFGSGGNETIFFTTADVSKADSFSSLTVLDPEDAAAAPSNRPDLKRVQHIIHTLRKKLNMSLFGVDFVIERDSGRYGIIDINIFPSYDDFPNFFYVLMKNILNMRSNSNFMPSSKQEVSSSSETHLSNPSGKQCLREPLEGFDQDDSGFDTGDSSDERKKKWRVDPGKSSPARRVTFVKGAVSCQNNVTKDTSGKILGKV